ncbi:MAG: OmpH family outer membrane protein [Flavobacteriales bacterium]
MKKLISALLLLLSFQTFGQKFCYVDSKYIMEEIPEYGIAMDQIDELSKKWQGELQTKKTELDDLFQYFQAESALLTPEMKRTREEEIIRKEKDLKELKHYYFGPEGLLYKKQQSMLKPIQDQVFNAIEAYADQYSYAIVFDKAGELIMLYTDERYNKSNEILKKLGY